MSFTFPNVSFGALNVSFATPNVSFGVANESFEIAIIYYLNWWTFKTTKTLKITHHGFEE